MRLLFGKECKKILLGIPYWFYVGILLVFLISQGQFHITPIEEPKPGMESYGGKTEEIPDQIMPLAVQSLYQEYTSNQYVAYPIGLYKNVSLKPAEQERIADILSELTGIPLKELQMEKESDGIESRILPKEGLDYAKFQERMQEVDEIIGGGSRYGREELIQYFGVTSITYEEAQADYQMIRQVDRLTGTQARLFSDYTVCMLTLLPVFPAVAFCMKEQRRKVRDVTESRRISSAHLIGIRYLALLAAMFLPVLVMGLVAGGMTQSFYIGMNTDSLAFLKYLVGWLLPSLMFTTALGMFTTVLTGTPIGIAVQFFWWFWALNRSMGNIANGTLGLFELIPRFNSKKGVAKFWDHFDLLLSNRIAYVALTVLLIAGTIWIFDKKRKGRWNDGGYMEKMARYFKK